MSLFTAAWSSQYWVSQVDQGCGGSSLVRFLYGIQISQLLARGSSLGSPGLVVDNAYLYNAVGNYCALPVAMVALYQQNRAPELKIFALPRANGGLQ